MYRTIRAKRSGECWVYERVRSGAGVQTVERPCASIFERKPSNASINVQSLYTRSPRTDSTALRFSSVYCPESKHSVNAIL